MSSIALKTRSSVWKVHSESLKSGVVMRSSRVLLLEQFVEDREDVGGLGDALGHEVVPLFRHAAIRAPQFGACLVVREHFHLALIENLDIGVVLANRHQLRVQELNAAFGIARL